MSADTPRRPEGFDDSLAMLRKSIEGQTATVLSLVEMRHRAAALHQIDELVRKAQEEIRFLHQSNALDEDGDYVG